MEEEKTCGLFGTSYPSPAKLPLLSPSSCSAHGICRLLLLFILQDFFFFFSPHFCILLASSVQGFSSVLKGILSVDALIPISHNLYSTLFFSFSATRGIIVMWTSICFLYTTSQVELYGLKLCLVSCPGSQYWEGWKSSHSGISSAYKVGAKLSGAFQAVASIHEVKHACLLFLLCYTRCRTGICCMLAHSPPLRVTVLMFYNIHSSIQVVLNYDLWLWSEGWVYLFVIISQMLSFSRLSIKNFTVLIKFYIKRPKEPLDRF